MRKKHRGKSGGQAGPNGAGGRRSPLVFAMRCGEVEFSLDLPTVLECLRIAENEACIPVLPGTWWEAVDKDYGE